MGAAVAQSPTLAMGTTEGRVGGRLEGALTFGRGTAHQGRPLAAPWGRAPTTPGSLPGLRWLSSARSPGEGSLLWSPWDGPSGRGWKSPWGGHVGVALLPVLPHTPSPVAAGPFRLLSHRSSRPPVWMTKWAQGLRAAEQGSGLERCWS